MNAVVLFSKHPANRRDVYVIVLLVIDRGIYHGNRRYQ